MAFPFIADLGHQSYTFRDAKGNTARFGFYVAFNGTGGTQVTAATTAAAVRTQLVLLSNAAYQVGIGFDPAVGVAQYGAQGVAYQNAEDKAVMVFQAADGSLHRYEIPAPVSTMFLADAQTVNPTETPVADLITAMITTTSGTHVSTRNGLALVNFMGGYYRRTKMRRKLNIFVLDPDLTPSTPAE